MKQILTGGLPEPGQPFTWGVKSGDMVYTNHGPVQKDGSILQAGIEEQTELTIQNLKAVLAEAGGTLDHVLQVQIFLIEGEDMKTVDQIYRRHFTAPYPNRATVVVKELVAPGMRIEMMATADLTA